LRVDWVVTCRYAESDGTIATIVGAGIDVVALPTLPHAAAIMIAIRLAGELEEVNQGQQHPMVVRIDGPDGKAVRTPQGDAAPPLTAEFSAPPNLTQRVPGWLVTPTFALAVQWWATQEGTYTIQVSVDGREPSPTPVHVVLQQPLR
jgi:hypothetical protein